MLFFLVGTIQELMHYLSYCILLYFVFVSFVTLVTFAFLLIYIFLHFQINFFNIYYIFYKSLLLSIKVVIVFIHFFFKQIKLLKDNTVYFYLWAIIYIKFIRTQD